MTREQMHCMHLSSISHLSKRKRGILHWKSIQFIVFELFCFSQCLLLARKRMKLSNPNWIWLQTIQWALLFYHGIRNENTKAIRARRKKSKQTLETNNQERKIKFSIAFLVQSSNDSDTKRSKNIWKIRLQIENFMLNSTGCINKLISMVQ